MRDLSRTIESGLSNLSKKRLPMNSRKTGTTIGPLKTRVRDFLTAGGQDEISGITVPKVFVMLYNHIECVKNEIEHIPPQVLARAWYGSVSEVGNIPTDTPGRLRCWLALATNHHGDETSTIKGTNLNFKRTLLNWLGLE